MIAALGGWPGRCLATVAMASATCVFAQQVEDLGPVAFDTRVQHGPLTPGPSGKGFVQLLYSMRGPAAGNGSNRRLDIIALNLETGDTKTITAGPEGELGPEVWRPTPIWSRGQNPRFYFMPYGKAPRFMAWDPATQTAWDSRPLFAQWPRTRLVYSLAIGTDGWVIAGGGADSPIARYNPATGQIIQTPPASLPDDPYPRYAQAVGGDDTTTYVLTGKTPYRVIARPHKGGPDRILLEFMDDALFDRGTPDGAPRLHQTPKAVFLHVSMRAGATLRVSHREGLRDTVVPGSGGAPSDLCWRLTRGTLRRIERRPRLSDDSPLPQPQPRVQIDPYTRSKSGIVRVWKETDGAWRALDVAVPTTPFRTSAAVPHPNGGIFGATFRRGPFYHYDTDGTLEVLGRPLMVEVSDMLELNGRIYIGGYAAARVFEYDPARPWTAGLAGPNELPASTAPTDPRMNPRQIANFMTEFGALSSQWLAADADGRIYVGTWSSRNREGGGLGILEPTESGWRVRSLIKGLERFPSTGLCATKDGRYIVMSTRVAAGGSKEEQPDSARVFVVDTTGDPAAFACDMAPLPGLTHLGFITAVDSTRVIGAAPVGKANAVLYLIDVVTGSVIATRKHDGAITGNMVAAADGYVYATERTPTGVRILRIAADLSTITRLTDVTGEYDRITIIGRNAYLTTTNNLANDADTLKRIPNLLSGQ